MAQARVRRRALGGLGSRPAREGENSIPFADRAAGPARRRYKMPRLEARIEGRGNGIRTNVVNMKEIAEALARSPAHATKVRSFAA